MPGQIQSPQKDDPDGVESMSQREYKARMTTLAENFLGQQHRGKTDNPDGSDQLPIKLPGSK